LVTLLHAMRQRDVKLGLATLCISGGLGMSVAVSR
jgi:acetyl-CoA C-acetyltransferase